MSSRSYIASRSQRLLVVALTILACVVLAPTATAAPGTGNGAPPFPVAFGGDSEPGWPCDFSFSEEVTGKLGGAYTSKFAILTAPSLRSVLTNPANGKSVTLNLTGPIQELVGGVGEHGGTILYDRFRGHSLIYEPPAPLDDDGNFLIEGSDDWSETWFTYVVGPANVTFEAFDLDGDGWTDWYHVVDFEPGKGTKVIDVCSLLD